MCLSYFCPHLKLLLTLTIYRVTDVLNICFLKQNNQITPFFLYSVSHPPASLPVSIYLSICSSPSYPVCLSPGKY